MAWGVNHRPAYGRAELQRLIDPQSIAILGLSASATSFGTRTLMNLRECRSARLYGVNAKIGRNGDALHGVPCFAAIADVPERVDCAVIATPREAVERLVEQCAAAGVGGCIIYASGYAETGREDRRRQQERLGAIAAGSGMRIVGPNCIGIANNYRRAGLTFLSTYETTPWRPGPVGLISQSGALGYTLVQACERGGNFSHFFTAGNSCDVDVCDFLSYLAEDPDCRAIACLFEGVADGERLIEAAEKALEADKPIVIYKMATGDAAERAAMSHTGTLAGTHAAYEAACRATGMIAVDNLEDVYEAASFLAKAGRPKARGVAVMATSGGACVIAAAKAERHGVAMPQPGPAAQAVLDAAVPEFGSARNPCDVTAQVINDPDSFTRCTTAMLGDPAYGALILPQVVAGELTTQRVPIVAGLAAGAGKPICITWINEWLGGPGAALYEANPNTAVFHSTDRCFRTLAAWQWRETVRAAGATSARTPSGRLEATEARRLLDAAGARLSEAQAKSVLALYGVPVAAEALVADADAAVAAAERIGYPVAVKLDSPDIAHKTEAGVVRLFRLNADAVRAAVAAVMAAAARIEPAPRIRGITVQPMIPPGIELVVGTRLDPQFGPLILVGMGGVLVELLDDTAVELAPVTPEQARSMLARLKGYRLLTGYRGSEPVDLDHLAEIVSAVSALATDLADDIAEIDVNPLTCSGGRIVAVDALIVRREGEKAE